MSTNVEATSRLRSKTCCTCVVGDLYGFAHEGVANKLFGELAQVRIVINGNDRWRCSRPSCLVPYLHSMDLTLYNVKHWSTSSV